MKHILGLDIGISSVGFSLINHESKTIEIMGAHLFDAAEDAKTGASLAEPRREAKGIRRVINRRSMRKKALLKFLENVHFSDLDKVKSPHSLSPWALRSEGLHRKLSDLEFARALYHIAKHRGFKSNRKESKKSNDEESKMKEGLNKLEKAFEASGKETIGAYLNDCEKKRNSQGEYSHTVKRERIESEIGILFEKQKTLGNIKATEAIKEEAKKIILFQRPLKSVTDMRGFCTHLSEEKRAAKFSFSAELFLFYSKINNLKLQKKDGEAFLITTEMKEKILEEGLSKSSPITYTKIRKLWTIEEDFLFNHVKYFKSKKKKSHSTEEDNHKEADEKAFKLSDYEKEKFFDFKGYHTLRQAIEKEDKLLWEKLKENQEILDFIAEIVSFNFDEKEIKEALKEKLQEVPEAILNNLADIDTFSKTINLSIKAVNILLPDLKKGKRYDEAVAEAKSSGKFKEKEKQKTNHKLPRLEKTNNPVVDRAVSQARKIINAIIERYGKPDSIHIELARDIGKSKASRDKIEKTQAQNRNDNESIKKEIREEHGFEPKRDDVIKYKLWEEQQGFCAYSQEYIKPQILFDGTSTEVDHIVPFSRSYDDSYTNKVLVFTQYNRDKGDQTPYEKWGQTLEWEKFEVFAKRLSIPKQKKYLLKEFKEEDWKERNLNDTRYMACYLKEHIKNNLPVKVSTISGGITSFLRHGWGLGSKDREKDHKHHAVDATIIACATPSMVKKVTSFNKRKEWESWRKKGESTPKPHMPPPWESFRKDVKDKEESIHVSRLPDRKMQGEAHKQTIKSFRKENPEGKQIIKRINLSSVTLTTLESMVDKERNKKLYDLLKEKLESNDDNAKKAFSSPIYMPRNNGTKGPQVKGIRIYDDSKSGLEIRGGHADNGEMIRIDVFSKANKKGHLDYYICPVYVMDFLKGELPNKVFDKKEFVEITPEHTFKFSLYKNDFVKLEKNNGEAIEGYYRGFDRATGNIDIIEHNKEEPKRGNGVKTLKSFNKYHVNYFGERFLIKKEKRLGFNHKKIMKD